MIQLTIKTECKTEVLPCRNDVQVKEVSNYLFNNYTCKGVKYQLTLNKRGK